MEYKNETVRYINGYKVTSRSVVLNPEEEEERLCEIRDALGKVVNTLKAKEKTA